MIEAPTIVDNAAVFRLATGERIMVSIPETGLGVMGYAIKVVSDRGLLLVQPSSGNAIDLYTHRSLAAEAIEKNRVVAVRDGVKVLDAGETQPTPNCPGCGQGPVCHVCERPTPRAKKFFDRLREDTAAGVALPVKGPDHG